MIKHCGPTRMRNMVNLIIPTHESDQPQCRYYDLVKQNDPTAIKRETHQREREHATWDATTDSTIHMSNATCEPACEVRRPARRPAQRPARRKCNSFKKDRVAYLIAHVVALVCYANDEIVCLKTDATSHATSRGRREGNRIGVFRALWWQFNWHW